MKAFTKTELSNAPFAMFECKRAGIEEGRRQTMMKRATMRKAKIAETRLRS